MLTSKRLVQAGSIWRTVGWYRRKTAEQNADTSAYTPDDAVQLAPVTAAVGLLARAAATSDVVIERYRSGGFWERVSDDLPAWADPDRQPNPWQSRPTYLWNLAANLLVSGNGIVSVRSRGWMGRWPDQVVSVPFRTTNIYVDGSRRTQSDVLDDMLGLPGYGGIIQEVRYAIDNRTDLTPLTALTPDGDILHLRYISKDDLVFGWSPLHWAVPPLRAAIAADAQAELAFKFPMPPGILFNKGKIGQETAKEAARYYRSVIAEPEKRHSPLFLSGDWQFISNFVPPDQIQLLDTRRFTYDVVASLFGIPAALMSSPTAPVAGSAIRNLQRGWTMGTVVPFLHLLAADHSALLPPGYRARFKPAHMLELEPVEQSHVNERYLNLGVIRRSEVREELGLKPIAGLDDEPFPNGGGGGQGDGGGREETSMNEMPTGMDKEDRIEDDEDGLSPTFGDFTFAAITAAFKCPALSRSA